MKENVLDVLMYLFETYIDAEEEPEPEPVAPEPEPEPEPVEPEPEPEPDPEPEEETPPPQPEPEPERNDLDLDALSRLVDLEKENEQAETPVETPSETVVEADQARRAIGASTGPRMRILPAPVCSTRRAAASRTACASCLPCAAALINASLENGGQLALLRSSRASCATP